MTKKRGLPLYYVSARGPKHSSAERPIFKAIVAAKTQKDVRELLSVLDGSSEGYGRSRLPSPVYSLYKVSRSSIYHKDRLVVAIYR